MTDELWDKFSGIDTQLNKALVDFPVGKEAQERQMTRDAFQILSGLDAAVKEVERAVQKRVHYEEAERPRGVDLACVHLIARGKIK